MCVKTEESLDGKLEEKETADGESEGENKTFRALYDVLQKESNGTTGWQVALM